MYSHSDAIDASRIAMIGYSNAVSQRVHMPSAFNSFRSKRILNVVDKPIENCDNVDLFLSAALHIR
jgi:hypothetical protein